MKESLVLLAAVLNVLKERWVSILQAVIVPMIIITVIDNTLGIIKGLEKLDSVFIIALSILLELLSLIFYTLIAVAIHRIIILGVNSVPKWGFNTYTKRERTFFLYSLLLIIITLFLYSTIFFVDHFMVIIFPIIFSAYVSLRFSLVFPACAIDKNISLRDSWLYTNNHVIFLFISTLLWPFILCLPLIILLTIMDMIGGAILAIIGAVVSTIMIVIYTYLLIGLLSLAYLKIMDNPDKG